MSLQNDLNNLFEEQYDNLANAIVLRACNDYFTCKKALKKGHTAWGRISNCKKELNSCIEFFNSKLYTVYTRGDARLKGHIVMKRIDDMVEDEENFPMMQGAFAEE